MCVTFIYVYMKDKCASFISHDGMWQAVLYMSILFDNGSLSQNTFVT